MVEYTKDAKSPNRKIMTVRIDEDLYSRFKFVAAEQGKSIQSLVEEFIWTAVDESERRTQEHVRALVEDFMEEKEEELEEAMLEDFFIKKLSAIYRGQYPKKSPNLVRDAYRRMKEKKEE
jgi:hypothetical protein